MEPAIPTMSQLTRYDVNRRDEFEVVREPLYDILTYAAAGQTTLTFFQNPIGQGGKTIEDTNMELAGSLPQPKNFLIETIEVYFFPGDLPVTEESDLATALLGPDFSNDVYTAYKLGSLDLFIGSKSYVNQGPLMRFPPRTRLDTQFGFMGQMKQAIAADETTSVSGDYASATGRPFILAPRIRLISQQNFSVKLTWSAVQALPSTVAARMGVVLDGLLYRESQ